MSLAARGQTGWTANPAVAARASAQRPSTNYDESRVPAYVLPDALVSADGRRVTGPSEWPRRRAELLEAFRTEVYGRRPGPPEQLTFDVIEQAPSMDGRAVLTRAAIVSHQAGRSHQFELILFLPAERSGPSPVFLLINNRESSNTDPTRATKSGFWPAEAMIARGYGIAALQYGQLAPDDKDRYRDGVLALFEGATTGERAPDAWAAIAAWGWGASRAMDYFRTDPRIDASRVALVGHSRGGKAALWAGAEDERFAMVISNESGEGGAALSRRQFGERTADLTRAFPHWFDLTYRTYAGRETALPVDQHLLLSLIAPRGLYVASADEDLWSDPRGEFLALAASSPVFALYGDPEIGATEMPPLDTPRVVGRRGYHIRRGAHDLTPYDWARFADFADATWRRSSGR